MMRQHKIPTIIGMVLLLIGLGGGLFLVQNSSGLFGLAQGGVTPEQLKITNVSDTSFSASWVTSKETPGFISYGETSKLGATFNDDRDKASGQTRNYFTHHITLTSLKPSTPYYFKIGSGGKLYDNSGQPYTLTTAPTISTSPPLADLSSGEILQNDGQPSKDAIVYLSFSGATPLSALVKDSGKWVISLNNARTTDLRQYARYDPSAQIEEIFIQGGPSGVSSAITTTSNDNPIPDITLGRTYDFRQILPLPSPSTSATDSQISVSPTPASSKFSFEPMASPSESSDELTIINPEDKEQITTQAPEFFGTGPGGKTVQIQVESPKKYTSKVVVDENNRWRWTPPNSLTPGEHKITVSYLGKTIQKTFTVLPVEAATQPAFTATPSGTIIPTPTPSPTKKLTLTPTPTSTTKKLTPTPTPTPKIIRTPTPTLSVEKRTSMPSTQSGIPVSGDFTPTLFVFAAGMIFILTGFIVKLVYLRSTHE